MIRTQISLTAEQMKRARRAAAEHRLSLAALIREALDHWLDAESEEAKRARALASVGGFQSGFKDTSERHDEVLGGGRW